MREQAQPVTTTGSLHVDGSDSPELVDHSQSRAKAANESRQPSRQMKLAVARRSKFEIPSLTLTRFGNG
jgi:hypothetical protein